MVIRVQSKIFLSTINTVGVVVNVLRTLIPEELLVLIINNELLKTAAIGLTVQNERSRLVIRFGVVQVEAVVRLHGGEFRLSTTGSPGQAIGNSVAILNVEIEVDIRVKRDGLTSERRLSESITPSVVSRASNSGLSSLLELLNGKIPAFEYFTSTKVENFREALTLSLGVRNESVVHQSGSPRDSSPVSSFAVVTRTGFTDINTNVREILGRAIVLVVISIGSINIRTGTNSYGLDKAD